MTSPSAPLPDLEPILTLAHTLHTTPSSHAVLLGAGVSIAAGVPSAWGVLEELIRQIATAEGADAGGDPAEWYRARFGREPEYETVLETVAPTPVERQRLLRGFFEPTPGDDEDRQPRPPSLAHRSLARLVAAGKVRIILTLNFDRLAETALREVGIEPVVVASSADLAGLAPLHTIDALVVHLHGDYLSPHTMLNTKAELAGYRSEIDRFLDRVLSDYGLLAVGWSATYDPALRDAIARQQARHYTSYWVEPGTQSQVATDLATARSMVVVPTTADAALGKLADTVQALIDRQGRHPLVLATAVSTAKRDLTGATTAVRLHDLMHAEFSSLRQHPDLLRTDFGGATEPLDIIYGRIDEACIVPAALAATAAYWGNEDTRKWWIPEITRHSEWPRGASGPTGLIESVNLPALHLLWIPAVAAVAAERFDLVLELLRKPRSDDAYGKSRLVAERLTPASLYGYIGASAPSNRLYELYRPMFTEHLGITGRAYEDAWELFEVIRLAEVVHATAGAKQLEAVHDTHNELLGAESEFNTAEREQDQQRIASARQARADAWFTHQEQLARYTGGQAWGTRPHVRVADDFDADRHPRSLRRR